MQSSPFPKSSSQTSSLRLRKGPYDIEGGGDEDGSVGMKLSALQNRNDELEKKLAHMQRQLAQLDPAYVSPNDDNAENKYRASSQFEQFVKAVYDRGSWLVGLLVVQSFSSIILSEYESLLNRHPALIYFLTMLIGAGGNAGNQAAVRMIREIAMKGNMSSTARNTLLTKEFGVACALCALVGLAGFSRAAMSSRTSWLEVFAITLSLLIIVFSSIVIGCVLPFILEAFKIDPAHSSTSIQVVMDILGVLLVCLVSSLLL